MTCHERGHNQTDDEDDLYFKVAGIRHSNSKKTKWVAESNGEKKKWYVLVPVEKCDKDTFYNQLL
jgi:hypothetical protein